MTASRSAHTRSAPPRASRWMCAVGVLAVLVGVLAARGAHAASGASLSIAVYLNATTPSYNLTFSATMASFGSQLDVGESTGGYLVLATPLDACTAPTLAVPLPASANSTAGGSEGGGNGTDATITPATLAPWFALVKRGNCNFQPKALNAQAGGAAFVVVFSTPDYAPTLITMSGDGTAGDSGVTIGAALIAYASYEALLPIMEANGGYVYVRVFNTDVATPWSAILFVSMLAFLISSFFILLFLTLDYMRNRRRARNFMRPALEPIPEDALKAIPEVEVTAEDVADVERNLTCAICLDDFKIGDRLKRLPCRHEFHVDCIVPWFERRQRLCPTCKQDITLLPNGTPWVAMNEAVAIEMQNLADGMQPDDTTSRPARAGSSRNLAAAAEAGAAGMSVSTLNLAAASVSDPAPQPTPLGRRASGSASYSEAAGAVAASTPSLAAEPAATMTLPRLPTQVSASPLMAQATSIDDLETVPF